MDNITKTIAGFGVMLSLALAGCDNDPNARKIQYMPDMADGPTVKAQEDYLDPPDHSVAADAVIYPDDFAIAEAEFRNQFPNKPEHIAEGKRLYNIYCKVCHGADGKGGGTLTDAYPKAMVPDITRDEMKAKKPGFYFLKITKGGPNMPSYGHSISRAERWMITLYINELQKN